MNEFREWTMWMMEGGILVILILEYWYDKKIEESKKKKRKVTKKQVKIIIDKDGNSRIAESPKDIDIQIQHEGR